MVSTSRRLGRSVAQNQRVLGMAILTNLQVLTPRRSPPKRGDLFVMKLPSERYLFGRVILADVPQARGPMPGANLIYIYNHQSLSIESDPAQLRPGRLLIPPVWTNSLPWTKGYFQTIDNSELGDFDVLRQHCFFRASLSPAAAGKFVDESGKELKHKSEPCGEWGLASYRWIDDHVSDALGIQRTPA